MYILGVSAFYHDSAAALIKDGRIVRAAAEERFSRVKHDNAFPYRAIQWCLEAEGIALSDVHALAYYEKPLRKFERILETFVDSYPWSLGAFLDGIPEWLGRKIRVEHIIRKELVYSGTIRFVPHHASHAALAFFASPFSDAAIVVADGVGEYRTTSLWSGHGIEIRELAGIDFPHSLGLFYSTITSFLGFRVNEDETKVMGLAAFGRPRFADELRRMLISDADGSFSLDMTYFSFRERARMWSTRMERSLGSPRKASQPLDQRTKDIAASLQVVLEEAYARIADEALRLSGANNICLSGGVALNAAANGALLSRLGHARVFVPGPAGDDGAAAGAALYVAHALEALPRAQPLSTLALGSSYDAAAIREELLSRGLSFEGPLDEISLASRAGEALASGAIVGWFQGAMEYGPRALGSRSILADPRAAESKTRVNAIKGRDASHPCAASALADTFDFFGIAESAPYAFMTVCAPLTSAAQERVPAIAHADGTCRLHAVSSGVFARLIEAFAERSGVPCVLNSSFNARGEPIVESPAQAIDTFLRLRDMDYLSIGPYFLSAHRTE